jgi:ketosteroid isomerase-like protein
MGATGFTGDRMSHRTVSSVFVAVILSGVAAFAHAQSRKAVLSTQDYVEIQQLYARYAQTIDAGDAEGWANTFTADGVFNNSSRGHDSLVTFVHDWRDKRRGASLRHWNSNLVVTPAADGARGAIYMLLLDVSEKAPTVTASYRYEDALVKTADGWKFKTRVLHRDAAAATQ